MSSVNLKEVLPAVQYKLWAVLAEASLPSTYLGGGTGIAAHRGHRVSIDFDLFTPDEFSETALATTLQTLGSLKVFKLERNTLLASLNGVKISVMRYPYPLLEPPILIERLPVAHLDDLAVMKLVAVVQRGTKKDFVDICELLDAGYTLNSLLQLTKQKLQGLEINTMHYLKSLTYFKDAEGDPMPKMLKPTTWGETKRRLEREVVAWSG